MSITLDKKRIDEIFEQHDHQADVLIAIYREVYPNWNEIESLTGYVSISQEGWKHICQKFIEFDQEHHPDVLAGGLWMSNGFSQMNPLTVVPCGYVTKKGEVISQKA